ncbi:MAG TPA: endo-1,4-beta-xylanase [Pseudolabrys sp.]|nr:endo-1,4-beta-xylanase [Pseudolabrys sp.]
MVPKISRRNALRVVCNACVVTQIPRALAANEQSLGALASRHGLMFGAAAASVIDTDPAYRSLYVSQAKVITTDVALKIGSIAPQPGPKRYESADRLLQFARQNGMAMRGHCLIWNEWVPAWIKAMSVPERQKFFDGYIEEVVARYAGKLQSWDIVNEPFWPGHKAPGGFRRGPWYEAFGPAYIRRAFERAAGVDRKTKFVLNEAQTERDDELGHAVRQGMLQLVRELKQSGVKLDVVGLQSHLQPRYPHDPTRFLEFVHAIADTGVDIYLTEFDVRDDTFPDDVSARDAMVAQTAEKYLNTVLQVPAVKAIITWELADNYSFYTDAARRQNPAATRLPRPLPYDDRMQRKPFWYAIARAIEGTRRA